MWQSYFKSHYTKQNCCVCPTGKSHEIAFTCNFNWHNTSLPEKGDWTNDPKDLLCRWKPL